MSCIDHVVLVVGDYARSRAFYEQALAPLAVRVVMEFTDDGNFAGFGDSHPFFWIGDKGERSGPTHIAFAAASRDQVDAFHAAAIAAGAVDNGAPGLRPHYHADYYGAFVLDPDGHNIEAVNHGPAGPAA